MHDVSNVDGGGWGCRPEAACHGAVVFVTDGLGLCDSVLWASHGATGSAQWCNGRTVAWGEAWSTALLKELHTCDDCRRHWSNKPPPKKNPKYFSLCKVASLNNLTLSLIFFKGFSVLLSKLK